MSFFDKLKHGVSEAGNKAKVLVEQNKLKLANVSKQSQIDKLHKEIGSKLTELHFAGQPINIELFSQQIEAISILKIEIEQNEQEIAALEEEKVCKQCGKENAMLAKICVHCNVPFDIIDVTKAQDKEDHLLIDRTNKD